MLRNMLKCYVTYMLKCYVHAELEFKWFFHVVGSVNQVHVTCYVHV